MFIFLFAFKFKIFPAPLGLLSPRRWTRRRAYAFHPHRLTPAGDFQAFFDALWHYCLPVMTLAFVLTGPLIKMTRRACCRS